MPVPSYFLIVLLILLCVAVRAILPAWRIRYCYSPYWSQVHLPNSIRMLPWRVLDVPRSIAQSHLQKEAEKSKSRLIEVFKKGPQPGTM